jgi:hypothetical protein
MRVPYFVSSSEFHFFSFFPSVRPSVRPSVFFSHFFFFLLSPNQVRFALSQWTSRTEKFKLAPFRLVPSTDFLFSSFSFLSVSASVPDGKHLSTPQNNMNKR